MNSVEYEHLNGHNHNTENGSVVCSSVRENTSFTPRQWLMVLLLGSINICASMVYSIQAPFYPAEAESKECTATEYGLVFGSYELTTFIMCPIIGSCMYKVGPKISYHVGLICTGVSVILFGLLTFLDDHFTFLAASFVLRISEAVGSSTVFIATSTIVTTNFPNSIATIFATLELTFGIGFSVGPTVGAAFFQLGGFPLPFIVLGSVLLSLCFLTFCIFIVCNLYPSPAEVNNSINNNNCTSSTIVSNGHRVDVSSSAPQTNSYAFLDLLKIPTINLYSFSNFSCAFCVGFLTATLEPHIRKYKLHQVMTGVMFLLYGGVYALMAPIVGKICDRIKQPVFFLLFGSILIFIAFLLIGPGPFFPVKSLLSLTMAGLIIFGLGLSGVYVSSFLLTLQEAKKNGFPDSSTTSSLVSALWMSCISLGCFVGPSVAGALVDSFGFRDATCFILVLEAIVIILLFIHVVLKNTSCGLRLANNNGDYVDSETRTLLPSNRR